MRTTVLILGILGGLVGSATVLFGPAAMGVDLGANPDPRGLALGINTWLALAFSAIGIVGAVLSRSLPRYGGAVLLAAGLGLIAVTVWSSTVSAWSPILAAPFFLIAAVLAFLSRGHKLGVGNLPEPPPSEAAR
jgi:hypothetical protein